MKTLCNWAILLMAFSLISISALAQNAISTGSISGQVTDASGAAMEGATVTAASDATGVKLTAKTNGTGFYSFPSLSVGPYDITVSQAGFKTAIAHGVVVQVGQNVAANVAMQVGEIAQSVTVTAEVPLLRTTESTVSTVVNENLIANLPLSGRRYTDFVLLTPNTNADGDFGLVSMAGQQGGADSGYANGNGSNSFTVDGASATSNYYWRSARSDARALRLRRAIDSGIRGDRQSLQRGLRRRGCRLRQHGNKIGNGLLPW